MGPEPSSDRQATVWVEVTLHPNSFLFSPGGCYATSV